MIRVPEGYIKLTPPSHQIKNKTNYILIIIYVGIFNGGNYNFSLNMLINNQT